MNKPLSHTVHAVVLAVLLAATLLGLASAHAAPAAGFPAGAIAKVGTDPRMVTSSYAGWNWANPDYVGYYSNGGRILTVVSLKQAGDGLSVQRVDLSKRRRVGAARSVSLAGWPDWGGFYAGPDRCLYVLCGRENPGEDDTLDVVAVRRYDRSWHLLGTAYVKGGATQGGIKGIYSPFEAGSPQMVLDGKRLVVHMSRLIYAMSGVHHQVNLTFEVDVRSMTARTFDELGGCAYSSHSFRQLVAMNRGDLVTIDHGDAYPRAIQLGVMAGYPDQRTVATYDLFEFNGATGDNFTGATVTGLASGPSGIVVVGTSIPQPDAPSGPLGSAGERRNVYAIWANPRTGAHLVHWLTSFAPDGTKDALEPRIVRVGRDKYAVLFSVQNGGAHSLVYRLVNSAGAVLARKSFSRAFFCASSDPILVGSKVYWTGISPSGAPSATRYLFGLNVSNPKRPSLLRR
ncbi:MAG TPA: hypothetical protein VMH50_04650 [Thermoleophilia bacterium]|nr:hypothetical protein [Thermoleophilia bacterium]